MSDPKGVVIGTAGHVDHGKTALVRALTGVETDRWREERERGLTIDIGFARLDLGEDTEVGVVDVPGHEDFLKNMLAGATGIDALLMVIAADEGPMPQTLEHLAIAQLLDIRRGVVALTKSDKVDEEWLELALETTRDLIDEDPVRRDWKIVPVSAQTGEGLEALRAELASLLADVERRRVDDVFRLPVDRAFTIHGTGTVVTGTVWSGAVSVGDTVRLFPGDDTARVRGLEVHDDRRDSVEAGRRCAAALVGVSPRGAERGSVLYANAAWMPSERLGVRVRSLPTARPIEHGQRVRLYLGTREVMARVLTDARAPILPGTSAWCVLELEAPLLARVRDRAILRFYSPVTTIGGVEVVELGPPREWTERAGAWEALLDGEDLDAFVAAVGLRGLRGLGVEAGPLETGLPPIRLTEVGQDASCPEIGGRWFPADAEERTQAEIVATVADLHARDRRAAAVSKEAVRSELADRCAPPLVEAAIRTLVSDGRLREEGPRVALPSHAPTLNEAETAARDRLVEAIETAGLQPPKIADLGKSLGLERAVLDDLLRLLQEEGATRAVTPEIHVAAAALSEMEGRVRELLGDGRVGSPAPFKETFGLSRKYLIPLLEYLDRTGVTRRTEEGRTLAGGNGR